MLAKCVCLFVIVRTEFVPQTDMRRSVDALMRTSMSAESKVLGFENIACVKSVLPWVAKRLPRFSSCCRTSKGVWPVSALHPAPSFPQARVAEMAMEQMKREMAECTFQPNVAKSQRHRPRGEVRCCRFCASHVLLFLFSVHAAHFLLLC